MVWVWDCIAGEFYGTNGDHVTADTVNNLNRLTVATSPAGKVEFTYDYLGRRVEKKVFQLSSGTFQLVKTERFVYDDFKQIEKLDGGNSNAVMQKIIWQPERLGQDVPLAVHDTAASATYFYFTDANKNVGQLMDAAGNIVAKYEYSPFGEITAQSGAYADANAFRFSSEYADAETGLVYYNYRYYYSILGQWLSRDPYERLEGNDINLYELVNNQPTNKTDNLGLCWSNIRALSHYEFGLGRDVSLDEVGCVPEVTASIQNVRNEWIRKVAAEAAAAAAALSCPNSKIVHYARWAGAHTSVFWIGGISLRQTAHCNLVKICLGDKCIWAYSCRINHRMNDPFRRPLDLHNENRTWWQRSEPGLPFNVYYNWSDSVAGAGG